MKVAAYCTRDVVVMPGDGSVEEAARLMRHHNVGDVVLVDGRRRPTGIVTDRDLVLEVLAPGLSTSALAVRDLVVASPLLLREDDDVLDALDVMREHAVRRLPVVDAAGEVSGIIAVDDILGLLTEMLDGVFQAVRQRGGRGAGARRRRGPPAGD